MKTSLPILLALLCLTLTAPASAQPKVLASIKPLQLIAAAVTGEAGAPEVLAGASASHHHHALRPSERRRLEEADVLLWVGPELEGYLARVVGELEAEVLQAGALPELVRRERGGMLDPHVWLDPGNAILIARALAGRLAVMDPARAGAYEENLRSFEAGLQDLDQALEQSLGAVPPYAVFHDAFQYFEARYGLEHAVAFTQSEETMPGIRQLLEIRARLEAASVRCLLVEPGLNVAQLRNVVESEDMRYVEVDSIGHNAGSYPELLEDIAAALLSCGN